MALVTMCDRCGAIIRHPNGVMRATIGALETPKTARKEYDLCISCATKVHSFLDGAVEEESKDG